MDGAPAQHRHAAARPRAPDHRVPGARDQWRPRSVDHAHLYRGGAREDSRRQEGREGNRNEIDGKSWRACATASSRTAAAAVCSARSGGAHFDTSRSLVQTADEALAIDDIRALFSAYPFEERGRFESSDPVLGRFWRSAGGPRGLRARHLHGHAVLGAVAVRRRHANPGPALAVRRWRRPAREERHRAVRRIRAFPTGSPRAATRRCCRRSFRHSRCSGSG